MSVEDGFRLEEINAFNSNVMAFAKENFPRETKKFMRRAAYKLEKHIKKAYAEEIGKHKDNKLIPATKRDKPYVYGKDEYSIRVKSKAPHAHLIEHGHVLWIRGKKTNKYVKGKNIVGKQAKQFKEEYDEMSYDFVDEILNKGLGV